MRSVRYLDLGPTTLWAVGEPVWEPVFDLPGPCDALEVADFDGDGSPEVAVGVASQVLILEPGSWTVAATWLGDVDPGEDELGTALAVADLDHDGRMDLVAGAPYGDVEDPPVGYVYVSTDVLPSP